MFQAVIEFSFVALFMVLLRRIISDCVLARKNVGHSRKTVLLLHRKEFAADVHVIIVSTTVK